MGSPLTTVRERERRIRVATTTRAEREKGRGGEGEIGLRGRAIFTGRLKNRGKN